MNHLTQETSLLTKFRMLLAFFNVVRDIERTDEVFQIAQRIPDSALEEDMQRIAVHPRAKQAFAAQKMLNFDIPALAQLPAGTLGREYAELMIRRGLSPDFYPPIPPGTKANFYRLHVYQSHDLWHVVTGFGANPAGELGLQAFYYAQNELPLPPLLLAAGILNGMLRAPKDVPHRIAEIARGWTMGKNAEILFGYDWLANMNKPLAEVRAELGIKTTTSALPAATAAASPAPQLGTAAARA